MRILRVLAVSLVLAAPAVAQRTVVSGTVKDPSGIPYSGGTMVATLSLPVGVSGATLNGVQISGATQRVTLDNTGSFLMQLPDNAVVVPGGTQWTFAVNISPGVPPPLGTGPQNCSVTLTITGASQSVTSSFASCPALSTVSGPGSSGVPVTNGLLAELRHLPGENPCFAVDASGNGNNGTGCVGTPPTAVAGSGGVLFAANGAISLPPALNAAMNTGTVQIFFNYNFTSNANQYNGLLSGSGAAANSSNLIMSLQTQADSTNSVLPMAETLCNNAFKTIYGEAYNGTNLLTWSPVNGATDNMWIGQIPLVDTVATISCFNLMTVGNLQLGGGAVNVGAAVQTYFTGTIYYSVFYNRALTQAEVNANSTFIIAAMNKRGITITGSRVVAVGTGNSVHYGDSQTQGFGAVAPFTSFLTPSGGAWSVLNAGELGTTAVRRVPPSPLADILLVPGVGRNFMSYWFGTNDICNVGFTAAQTADAIAAASRQRRLAGWKVGVVTAMSRGACSDVTRDALNTLIRQQWPTYADSLIDLAADPNVGGDATSGNTIYFQADAIHPTDFTNRTIIAPMVNRAMSRLYGAQGFSSGSTYVAAATAANATTAGTCSGFTCTLTFAANVFPVGATLVCTGITPAGYNNPAGLGWNTLTSTGTQVTFWNTVSGLGPITVQGSCSSPQQADGDQNYTVNFGAGNHTLNTCRGFTGQNINIRNINAAATTLVPFQSETITGGAAPTTLAANTTVILQSQLVSAAAAGCNWVRLQ